MSYQSYDDSPGISKSEEKLRALRIPAKLTGKSVLDLGCNEGYFAIEMKRRGASRVVGLDHNEKAIAGARQRANDAGLEVEFICGDMFSMPDGPFDLVLLLSALHYITEPGKLFRQIHRVLAPAGMLLLECGVAPSYGQTVHRALRSIDDALFPTFELLRDVWLADFAVRLTSRSPNQAGDPIPRSVYHCHRSKPIVMLVEGAGGAGKSVLASRFSSAVIISTDVLFSPARSSGRMFYPEEQKLYDTTKIKFNGSHRLAWESLKEDERVRQFFVQTIARAVRLCHAALMVVEGHVISDLAAEIVKLLEPDYRCWRANAAPRLPLSK